MTEAHFSSSADIVERLRSSEPLPVCPFDSLSPHYRTMPDDKPCPICGQENTLEGPDKCRGADTRVMKEAADEIERLRRVVSFKQRVERVTGAPAQGAVESAPFRMCDLCHTWNRKPCGDQCGWDPNSAPWEDATQPPAAPVEMSASSLVGLPEYLDYLEQSLVDLDIDLKLPENMQSPSVWADRVRAALSRSSADNWEDDPAADERWNAGCDFAMKQLCNFLGVEPSSLSWDAATETVDGDVQAVIGNILRAKLGEDWGPGDTSDQPQGAWQPIETAPHEQLVLLGWWYAPLMDSVPKWECETGMASHGFRRNGISTMSRHGRATHWQPLPASPLSRPQSEGR